MGLIKTNGYNIKGVELPQAYAKIQRLYIENGNLARVYFGISSNRDNLNQGLNLEEQMYECEIDKDTKLYEQIYTMAKNDLFTDWEDDIVTTVEEAIPEPTEEIETIPDTEVSEESIAEIESKETQE